MSFLIAQAVTEMSAMSQVLLGVVSFATGVLVGWYLAVDLEMLTREQLQKAISIVITAVWAFSVIADIILLDYSTPFVLYGIMGAVAGYLFSKDGTPINLSG